MTYFSKQPGVYALIIKIEQLSKLKIGALGTIEFLPGYYIYVGSALNGLAARIGRHRRKEKRMHWHIDYLLARAKLTEVWQIPTTRKLECTLSQHISKYADSSVHGFGCSDCNCSSHLYFFKDYSSIKKLLKNVKSKLKAHVFRLIILLWMLAAWALLRRFSTGMDITTL